jgi:hypothetical protein
MSATLHAAMSDVAVAVVGHGLLVVPQVAAKCPGAGHDFASVDFEFGDTDLHRNPNRVEAHR